MKVMSIVGVRPEFVMATPVSRALDERHEEVLIHTGQHYDEVLSDVFFEELELPTPAYELGVGSAPRRVQISKMLTHLERIVDRENPDIVQVYGDTNTTAAGTLAAVSCDVTLSHVESGLRSYDVSMAEEKNRILTDHCADILFAPIPAAIDNLRREGVTGRVCLSGDVRRDSLELVRGVSIDEPAIFEQLGYRRGEYAVATVHRASNIENETILRSIVNGLTSVSFPVIVPLHPGTESKLRAYGLYEKVNNALDVVEPVGYPEFVDLLEGAGCVATDSGGIQREAMMLGTPCVTLREETEWVGTVKNEYNEVVGTRAEQIRHGIAAARERPRRSVALETGVARRIVTLLEEYDTQGDVVETGGRRRAADNRPDRPVKVSGWLQRPHRRTDG